MNDTSAASLQRRLVAAGLSTEAAAQLTALSKPAVRFTTNPFAHEDDARIGQSRLGGSADVGDGFEWPYWKSRPLDFLAQVNLAEIGPFACCSTLPQEGLLAFFYDPEQETWGFDPKDRGSWLVHYEPSSQGLHRIASPDATAQVFAPCSVDFNEAQTLPAVDSLVIDDLKLSSHDADKYYDFLDELESEIEEESGHQLLGHPSPIQGDMQLECQLAWHGLYCGDSSGYEDPRAAALRPGAKEWRLLLQIDSDDNAEMMWGDCGRLYFWLTNDAMRQRAFLESWMVLQCS